MNQNTWYRIAGAAGVIGLLAGAVGGTRMLYRWLAARRLWLARLIYLLLLIGMIPATIFGDEMVLRSGVLTFGGGYTIWHDVLFGMFLFALPPILYEAFCRYWHVPI